MDSRRVGYVEWDKVRGHLPDIWRLPALALAEEYGIGAWIAALLDPEPTHPDDRKKTISPPPKFVFTANDSSALPPPTSSPRRGRPPKAGSPTKSQTPGRKPRVTKAVKEAGAAAARQASETLQAALDSAASVAETESEVGERGGADADGEKVTVAVEQAVEVKGNVETTTTNVRVEMPAGSPQLPLPGNTEDMIAKAKEMVEEAQRLESTSSKGKRKVAALDDSEDEEKDGALQPAKKARLLEQEVRRQKVRNRALFGVAATLAIGSVVGLFTTTRWERNPLTTFTNRAVIPYVLGGW
jgi:hypothetical protein